MTLMALVVSMLLVQDAPGRPSVDAVVGLEFSAEPKSQSSVTEFDTARGRALWRLDVNGKTMTGTMTLFPTRAVVRRITLRKDTKA